MCCNPLLHEIIFIKYFSYKYTFLYVKRSGKRKDKYIKNKENKENGFKTPRSNLIDNINKKTQFKEYIIRIIIFYPLNT